MQKVTKIVLEITAKISETLAVKSCSATSSFDAYQPKVPEAVRKLAEAKKNR